MYGFFTEGCRHDLFRMRLATWNEFPEALMCRNVARSAIPDPYRSGVRSFLYAASKTEE